MSPRSPMYSGSRGGSWRAVSMSLNAFSLSFFWWRRRARRGEGAVDHKDVPAARRWRVWTPLQGGLHPLEVDLSPLQVGAGVARVEPQRRVEVGEGPRQVLLRGIGGSAVGVGLEEVRGGLEDQGVVDDGGVDQARRLPGEAAVEE